MSAEPDLRNVRFEAVAPRWNTAWREHYKRYAAALGEPVDDAVATTVWSWLLARAHGVEGVLAIADDEVAGFAHFRPFPRTLHGNEACFLDDLWVAESHRRTGLGRGLIERVCAIARERGWSQVRWVSERDNAAGRRLYDGIAENWQLQTYRIDLETSPVSDGPIPDRSKSASSITTEDLRT